MIKMLKIGTLLNSTTNFFRDQLNNFNFSFKVFEYKKINLYKFYFGEWRAK